MAEETFCSSFQILHLIFMYHLFFTLYLNTFIDLRVTIDFIYKTNISFHCNYTFKV